MSTTDPIVPDPAAEAAAATAAQVATATAEAATAAAATAAAAAAAVPIKYELKLGEASPLDASDLEKVTAFATAQKLSVEAAAALLKHQEETAGGLINRQKEALETQKQAWETEIASDKELGGERLKVTIETTKRVMDRFSPPGSPFRAMLETTGYGNHPEWVRFINNIGKAMQEDKPIVARTAEGSAKKSHADILFGPTT